MKPWPRSPRPTSTPRSPSAPALIDRSERGKLALTGSQAKEFLQGQVSNDVEALTPGTGCYAAFLTPKGKMLGDLRVLDAGDELLLDTERVALQPLFNMIRRGTIGYDAQLHKRTLERGLISLIGPESAAVAGATALQHEEHAHVELELQRDPGAGDPHRRRDRPAVRRGSHRRAARSLAQRPAPRRSPRRPPSACGSSAGGPATGSSSTKA